MARPKRDPKALNADIDKMISTMRRKFVDLPADVQINVIKVAIMWEKTKHGIKENEEGSFFNDGYDNPAETENDDSDSELG